MRTLKGQLAKLLEGSQCQWEKALPWISLYFRASPHASTGYSPSSVFLCRDIRLPIDLALLKPKETEKSHNYWDQERHIERVYDKVRDKLKTVSDGKPVSYTHLTLPTTPYV